MVKVMEVRKPSDAENATASHVFRMDVSLTPDGAVHVETSMHPIVLHAGEALILTALRRSVADMERLGLKEWQREFARAHQRNA